ncbi:NAD(P)-dependent oxidoreductase [Pseudomonadota bacterium]|nr:NAD(P)-dependent oxidoreductase [Pseudomonadota bacterium]
MNLQDEVLNSFQNKDVVVTGGTGLIGRQVVDLLLHAGANIRVISLDKINLSDKVEYIYGDLTDFSFCKDALSGAETVFHLAGIKGSAGVSSSHLASHFVPTLMFNTNTLEACRLNNVKRAIYTSSIGAYANNEYFVEQEAGDFSDSPMDFAGWAKRMGELQIHAYNKQYNLSNYAVVRPSNVYGPGDNFDPDNAMVIPSLISRIESGENPLLVWGDGSAVRDLVFSSDVAAGMLQAAYYGTEGGYVNLGSGSGVSILELVQTLAELGNFEYEFDTTKPSGFPKRVMDISKAKLMLGYNPITSLKDGLSSTWEWYKKNKKEFELKKNYFKQ